MRKLGFAICLTVLVCASAAWTQDSAVKGEAPPSSGVRDKCPVCGMFIAKYPDWVASMTDKDGKIFFFDGVKDLCKFYFVPGKYGYKEPPAGWKDISVTDYYDVRPIDGRKAFYVIGSDVYGPMGKELIPFERKEDAREFLHDHHGTRIISFEEVTRDLLLSLDQ